jgi:hypothetical protein
LNSIRREYAFFLKTFETSLNSFIRYIKENSEFKKFVFQNKKISNRTQFIEILFSPLSHLSNVLCVFQKLSTSKDESVILAKVDLADLCTMLEEINKILNEKKEYALMLKQKAENELERIFFVDSIDDLPVSHFLG